METVWKGMSEMEEVVLCGASAYNKKFYLNEDFKGLAGAASFRGKVNQITDIDELRNAIKNI